MKIKVTENVTSIFNAAVAILPSKLQQRSTWPIEELYGAIISSKKGGPIVHAMKTWTPTISLRNLETGDVRRFSTFS